MSKVLPAVPVASSVRGIACMVAGMALLTLNNAVTKGLTVGYPPGQIVVLRAAFVFLPIAFLVWRDGGLSVLRINNLAGQSVRAGFLVVSTFLMIMALRLLPLADVMAITFAGPLVITALAGPMLGEKVGWRRWGAVFVGFLGILIMLKPDPAVFQLAALLPLCVAVSSSLRDLVTRRISAGESSTAILCFSTGAVLLSGLFTLPFAAVPIAHADLPFFAIAGCLQGAAHYILIEAFRHGEAAVVAPFKYSALLWATVFGALMFGDFPDAWIWVGSIPVIASGLYILRRESLARRRTRNG
ncbi:MAG: EamA family transporter [Alphaproteobacteria bacterium]|nr:EamA family transporter [Alphaproteobacteria bacterium]